VIFDSPEHAAAWQREQQHLHPRDYRPMNVYQCDYFAHFHLTSRPVSMVNGTLKEDGAKPVAAPQPRQPPARSYKWRKDNSTVFNPEAFAAGFKDGLTRKQMADQSGATYANVCAILRNIGLGNPPQGPQKSKPANGIRKLATNLQEIDLQQQALEAQLAQLAQDRARIIELTRVKVEWVAEGSSIKVGKHNECIILTVADWHTVTEGLRTLLDAQQEEVKL
jgi:hypothetical protein